MQAHPVPSNADRTIACRGEQFRIYLDKETIARRVADLGRQITESYEGKKPILIGVLNGAFMFFADLLREIDLECEMDFIKLSSYGDAKVSSGAVADLKRVDADLKGRHVIIVEDIVDTGLSMQYIIEKMKSYEPASLKVAVLLHKYEATKVDLNLEYVAFRIPNLFVIGYGLDYGQLGRNIPEIYILDE